MNLSSIKKILSAFKNIFGTTNNKNIYRPTYRVLEIIQNDEHEYITKIQIINKNITFNAKPEEILAQDDIVNEFSPTDIRTLTYLGYLAIDSPKYKILAQRLSEADDRLLFAIQKKGEKKVTLKTAEQIIQEKDIVTNLNANDARLVGYTYGTEATAAEKSQKQELINELKNNK
jgi:hypothetical protein